MGGDTTTITNDVLAERMGGLHDDLGRIELQLSRLVPREVYDAHRVADDARIVSLEKRADAGEAERQKDAKEAAERQRQMLRWVIGAIVVPILLFVWQMWLSTHGGKA